MSQAPRARRLSAVLFLDVVGSTQIASDLGDRRWRELLTRFRKTVRVLLKRYDGHEEDTAGDGFFATFPAPEQAVRAADAIVRAVQVHGVDVRCGVHFGECEVVDGRLAGIAVHIGSRVMSLAGPAEVLVTSTVRDLVAGSGMAFEDLSAHELKGVPGTWQLFALRELEGDPVAQPLTGEQAAASLAGVQPATPTRRRLPVVAGIAAAVVAAVVVVVLVLSEGGGSPRPTGAASGIRTATTSTSPSAGSPTPPLQLTEALVRLNPETGKVTQTAERVLEGGLGGTRYAVDARTGEVDPSRVGGGDVATGDHQVWVSGATSRSPNARVVLEQLDPVTKRGIRQVVLPGEFGTVLGHIAVGDGFVWGLYPGGLARVSEARGNDTPTLVELGTAKADDISAFDGQVWVIDILGGVLHQIDPVEAKLVRSVEVAIAPDVIDVGPAGLWCLNSSGGFAFSVDQGTGDAGVPISVGKRPVALAVGTDAVWVANRDDGTVARIDPAQNVVVATYEVPGTPVALDIDPVTGAVWVYLA